MSVTLHTTLGDLKIELRCAKGEAPKASENFLALAASEYYNGTRFHRNIKGFIVQGGDPSGKCLVPSSTFSSLFCFATRTLSIVASSPFQRDSLSLSPLRRASLSLALAVSLSLKLGSSTHTTSL